MSCVLGTQNIKKKKKSKSLWPQVVNLIFLQYSLDKMPLGRTTPFELSATKFTNQFGLETVSFAAKKRTIQYTHIPSYIYSKV